MRFGGLIAVNELDDGCQTGRDLRSDRSERRGKNDGFQYFDGRLRADFRRHKYQGKRINGMRPYQISRHRRFAHFSKYQTFPFDDAFWKTS